MSNTTHQLKHQDETNYHAFFRDKTMTISSVGMSFTAAGIITEKHNFKSASGKDFIVLFVDPYTLLVEQQWRAESEIELQIIDSGQWHALKKQYDVIKALF